MRFATGLFLCWAVAGCGAGLPQREEPAGNCLKESDCGDTGAVCKDNQCTACSAHSECASQVCDTYGDLVGAGKCVASSEVLYAAAPDESDQSCDQRLGTQSLPFCGIDKALAKLVMAPNKVIRLLPSPSGYRVPALTAGAGKVVLIGSGQFAAGQATALTVGDEETNQLTIGAGATVLLDGVIVQTTGIGAAAGAKVTIRRSVLQALSGATFEGSSVVMDRDLFQENVGAFVFRSATVSLTNSFFTASMPEAGQGLLDFSSTSGVFQFNTVAYNTMPALTQPVLSCSGTGGVTVKNAIFVQNAATQQLGQGCKTVPGSVVVGTADPAAGQIKQAPAFENPLGRDLRLKPRDPTNLQYLIDKATAVDAASEKHTDHDYYGSPRPQGTGADIGAFEAAP